jgi:hypothetical protein
VLNLTGLTLTLLYHNTTTGILAEARSVSQINISDWKRKVVVSRTNSKKNLFRVSHNGWNAIIPLVFMESPAVTEIKPTLEVANELGVDANEIQHQKPMSYAGCLRQKAKEKKIMIMTGTSKENWEAIKKEYDISKRDFGKKIKFVSDPFKRKIIFRDVEQAFVLASQGFSKPALILAGGVIEELLRLYLEHKNITPKGNRFIDYIQACEDKSLLKRGVFRLSDSIRDFRNLVHLNNEKEKSHTISKATAKGAVSSIFTIANDFQ